MSQDNKQFKIINTTDYIKSLENINKNPHNIGLKEEALKQFKDLFPVVSDSDFFKITDVNNK